MNDSSELPQDVHPVATLLPWYANNTLTDRDRAEVAEHLSHCPSCRNELEEIQVLGSMLREGYSELPDPSPHMKEKVLAAVGRVPLSSSIPKKADKPSPLPPPTLFDHINSFLRGLLAPKWAPALAAGLLMVQFGAIMWSLNSSPIGPTNGDEIYQRGIPMASVYLEISFLETTQERDIRQVIRSLEGHIADGPTEEGTYVIAIPGETSINVQQVVESLKSRQDIIRKIEFKEP